MLSSLTARRAAGIGRRFVPRGTTSRTVPLYMLSGGALLVPIGLTTRFYSSTVTSCDAAASMRPAVVDTSQLIQAPPADKKGVLRPAKAIVKAIRMLIRAIQLAMTLTPLLFLSPILKRTGQRRRLTHRLTKSQRTNAAGTRAADTDRFDWLSQHYLRFCTRCVEYSGATVIKLMQWLSSRPDLVGHDFCNTFSKLQDDTTPHAWKYTQQALKEAYGDDWEDHIHIDKEVIGSGCIGQVYKGYVKRKDKTNVASPSSNDEKIAVAVKVLHPSSNKTAMETDLDWMRLLARVLPYVSEPLAWLNPTGAVEEFGRMLTLQLDLRHEGRNLERFQRDFKDDETILFPEVLPAYTPTRRVLIETFIEGIPVMEFAQQQRASSDDKAKERLSHLCVAGIQAVCKMIFQNNFCHGDLHPGNVLVTPNGKQLVLLDVGIVNEYTDANHELIVNVLTSFIRYDGRQAARYMMADTDAKAANNDLQKHSSLTGDEHVSRTDEEVNRYLDTIEGIAEEAQATDYVMESLGTYISQICDAAAEYHVLMNQSFVSAALAVKVQEGIMLALDPSIEIWRVANPIILKAEARRRARNFFGVSDDSSASGLFGWPQWVKDLASSMTNGS